ncbi:hypothetical protein OIY81_3709 [Cryptosporidium canis]|nr:hypothetical protein OIY81_3709 [Cryptosporidium canis]
MLDQSEEGKPAVVPKSHIQLLIETGPLVSIDTPEGQLLVHHLRRSAKEDIADQVNALQQVLGVMHGVDVSPIDEDPAVGPQSRDEDRRGGAVADHPFARDSLVNNRAQEYLKGRVEHVLDEVVVQGHGNDHLINREELHRDSGQDSILSPGQLVVVPDKDAREDLLLECRVEEHHEQEVSQVVLLVKPGRKCQVDCRLGVLVHLSVPLHPKDIQVCQGLHSKVRLVGLKLVLGISGSPRRGLQSLLRAEAALVGLPHPDWTEARVNRMKKLPDLVQSRELGSLVKVILGQNPEGAAQGPRPACNSKHENVVHRGPKDLPQQRQEDRLVVLTQTDKPLIKVRVHLDALLSLEQEEHGDSSSPKA